jgi:serine/threonine protein kinase
MSKTTELLKELAALLDRGLITRSEFDREKRKILGPPSEPEITRDQDTGQTVLTPAPSTTHALGTDSDETDETSTTDSGTDIPHSIGAYRILDVVGEGGMGRVFRARHRTDALARRQGGDVALKVLHPQFARRPKIALRFEREAELGIKLDHPCVVRVHQLIMDRGQVALVMELVHGRQINEIYRPANGPVTWKTIEPLFMQLLDAVAHAHEQGVIHRDLKPDNIMITADDQIKVLDFGIAKDLDDGMTQTGLGMGTVDFMAPEQYTNAKHVGPTADIYALGVMLYQLLSARLPWNAGDSKFTIMEQKKVGKFPSPAEYSQTIPTHVAQAIELCISADPKNRPASAADLKELLSQSSDEGEPIKIELAKTELNSESPSEQTVYPAPPVVPDPPASGGRTAFFAAMFGVIGLGGLGGGGWYIWTELDDRDGHSSRADPDEDEDRESERDDDESNPDRDDDEGRSAKAPSTRDVCTHYVDNFAFEGESSKTERTREFDDCTDDVRDFRAEMNRDQWEGFARCYVETSTEDESAECFELYYEPEEAEDTGWNVAAIEEEWSEEPNMPRYTEEAMAAAMPWDQDESGWGNWRLKQSEDLLEIYNVQIPGGVRVQLSPISTGWINVQTTSEQFVLYSGLWTQEAIFTSLGEVSEPVPETPLADATVSQNYKYGGFLISIETAYMYICHASQDWCLDLSSYSNGYLSISTPTDSLILLSGDQASSITTWTTE